MVQRWPRFPGVLPAASRRVSVLGVRGSRACRCVRAAGWCGMRGARHGRKRWALACASGVGVVGLLLLVWCWCVPAWIWEASKHGIGISSRRFFVGPRPAIAHVRNMAPSNTQASIHSPVHSIHSSISTAAGACVCVCVCDLSQEKKNLLALCGWSQLELHDWPSSCSHMHFNQLCPARRCYR